MSLMKPTMGEMLDRIKVLRVKIQHAKTAGVAWEHFENEADEIRGALRQRPDAHKVDANLLIELHEIHEAIWPLIATSPPELLRLNARRTAIREEIDKATGEFRGPEKI